MSIAYDIVTQQHGGVIEFDSRVGEFTCGRKSRRLIGGDGAEAPVGK
jgi:hypothetical protein